MRTKKPTEQPPRCYSYIRFSTPKQLKGDSLRRQLELSERYAKEKGLVLDDSLKMQDLGLSAYKGEHRTKGALGGFLKLVDANKIPLNSHLIIEELDRLTRQGILEAVNLFTGILLKGITLHTVVDEMTYTENSFDMGQLVISAYKLSAGHEESRKKSERVSEAWQNKRNNIDKKKLTAHCPSWLTLNKEKNKFEPISERVKQIKTIFELSRSGFGSNRIVKTLNERGHGWLPKNGWQKSYIDKILYSRAVLGEFQPHVGTPAERKPIGEPIKDYYPAVISEELFYSVQTRGKQFAGRTGKISNLFTGLAKCGHCGSPIRFANKGENKGAYLICDNAVRGRGCWFHSWRYDEIERLVLTYCKGLDISDLLREENSSKDFEREQLSNEMASIMGNLTRFAKRESNLLEQIADAEDKDIRVALNGKLSDVLSEQKTLTETKKQLDNLISKASSERQDVAEQVKDLKELMQFMATETGEKRIAVRERLRSRLRSLVDFIKIYPIGDERMKPWLKKLTKTERKKHRSLTIHFKSGSYRILSPLTGTAIIQAYEKEEGATFFPFINRSGLPDADVSLDNDREAKRQELEDRVTKRMARRLRGRSK